MKQNLKEMKLMKSKFYGNLTKNADYKMINYETLEFTYGFAKQKAGRLRNNRQNRARKILAGFLGHPV